VELTIVHEPHGLDTPYDTRFEERRPRDPAGGDMVAIGFLTRPGGRAQTARLDWRRNGRLQPPILARAASFSTDEDRWLVELGVLDAGDHIDYWITAEGRGDQVSSPMYAFAVRRWRRLAQVVGVVTTTEGAEFATVSEDDRPGVTLRVEAVGDRGSVRLTVATRADAPGPIEPNSVLLASAIPIADSSIAVRADPLTGLLYVHQYPGNAVERARAVGPITVRWLEEADGPLASVDLVGPLADGEALVGFGERFDALDQRGRALDVTVYEQYKNQGNRSYLPVPFFISSRGYACLVEGSTRVVYDLGRNVHDRWRCTIDSVRATVSFVLTMGSPREAVAGLTAQTGRPATLPPWAFGLWMSSNEWNSQRRVEDEVEQSKDAAIPATVVVIEAWSDETTFYVWNGAQYDAQDGRSALQLDSFSFPADGPWPDPKGMVDQLHAAGIRLLLWQIPALKAAATPHAQHDRDISHAIDRGYVIAGEDGAPYRNPAFWFRDALIPDFTSPEATRWWLEKRAYLLDEIGIDGFKTDGGEHLQGRGLRSFDGRCGAELVNAYPNLYVGAYHHFARERRGGDALTFSRAGHTGAGALPAHWAGDENSTWEAFRQSLVAGLTAGLSGVPFWGWDLAGFSGDLPSAELYLRSTAMAALCPIMQYHSEYNPDGPSRDRTPWNVESVTGDDRVVPVFRFFAYLRMNLLPYIVSEAAYCSMSGEPMMRALLLDHPEDPLAWHIDDQYRFGRSLLVAPIVEPNVTRRRLYLPAGLWYDLWHGTSHRGGNWLEVEAPINRIPVFVAAGSILPFNLGSEGSLGDDVGNAVDRYRRLTFRVFPDDSGNAQCEWVSAAGEPHLISSDISEVGDMFIDIPPLQTPCEVSLQGHSVVSISASTARQRVRLA